MEMIAVLIKNEMCGCIWQVLWVCWEYMNMKFHGITNQIKGVFLWGAILPTILLCIQLSFLVYNVENGHAHVLLPVYVLTLYRRIKIKWLVMQRYFYNEILFIMSPNIFYVV